MRGLKPSSEELIVVMEKNHLSTKHSGVVDPSLSSPHFDEDATLLSARPVVPLHEVNAETRSRRRVIFGLTILAASLLGAITATLLFMRSEQNAQRAADTKVSQPVVSSSGAAGGSTSQSAEARGPVFKEQEDESLAAEVPGTPSSSLKKRPTAAISSSSVRPARAGNPDFERAEDFKTDEMELRRAERRDARRDARRERRQRREQISDDLLRIREIFEGSPRP